MSFLFFFFNDTATTEIYTLSLHDALPIWPGLDRLRGDGMNHGVGFGIRSANTGEPGSRNLHAWRAKIKDSRGRSEEHTSELQSRLHLVCRLLLEKKKIQNEPKQRERMRRV